MRRISVSSATANSSRRKMVTPAMHQAKFFSTTRPQHSSGSSHRGPVQTAHLSPASLEAFHAAIVEERQQLEVTKADFEKTVRLFFDTREKLLQELGLVAGAGARYRQVEAPQTLLPDRRPFQFGAVSVDRHAATAAERAASNARSLPSEMSSIIADAAKQKEEQHKEQQQRLQQLEEMNHYLQNRVANLEAQLDVAQQQLQEAKGGGIEDDSNKEENDGEDIIEEDEVEDGGKEDADHRDGDGGGAVNFASESEEMEPEPVASVGDESTNKSVNDDVVTPAAVVSTATTATTTTPPVPPASANSLQSETPAKATPQPSVAKRPHDDDDGLDDILRGLKLKTAAKKHGVPEFLKEPAFIKKERSRNKKKRKMR